MTTDKDSKKKLSEAVDAAERRTKGNFRRNLYSLAEGQSSRAEIKRLSKELMRAFLAWGSETPDNVDCAKRVEFGWVQNPEYRPGTTCGLKLKGKPILLSALVNYAEGSGIPEIAKEAYPELTQEEWDAALRMATMVLLALEQEILTRESA